MSNDPANQDYRDCQCEVDAADDIDIERAIEAVTYLEDEFNHNWFAGLPVLDFTAYYSRLKELEHLRGRL